MSTSSEPIAIVGRACVLPGALTPTELWDAVSAGRDLVSAAPEGYWRTPPANVALSGPDAPGDGTWTDRGGYVRGFDRVFDPGGFAIPADEVAALDTSIQWVLHCAREALRDSGGESAPNTGLILGNLSYPSRSLARLSEGVWLGQQAHLLGGRAAAAAGIDPVAPVNRFMSGLPALLPARLLRLGGPSFALDAACASSLYAVALACDALRDGRSDRMLAGAVNCADDLFIHVGFCALQAMSRTGQSRPFHDGADGLIPAEGAGILVLERLSDAVARGAEIYGLIRGIGLSNDGRGRGLLVPNPTGQERAMRLAYARARLAPADISLLECHATGTPVGDAVEVQSTARVYDGLADVPIGSIKSNMGHLITASGVAGLIKVTEAMRHGVRPPTLHVDEPTRALAGSPFRLLTQAEPWRVEGPRRAAISNFGFGGNNAHVIVEEPSSGAVAWQALPAPTDTVSIVGLEVRAADGEGLDDFRRHLLGFESRVVDGADGPGATADHVDLPLLGLPFAPADLDHSLYQQLAMLRVVSDLVARHAPPAERTSVVIGMQCDPDVARFGARLRLPAWVDAWRRAGVELPDAWLAGALDAFGETGGAATVVGTMPNMPANRLSNAFDLQGPGFTVSAEEGSGTVALGIGVRALLQGEVDAAVVGAVDACCEPVHRAAAAAVLPQGKHVPGDAAVVLLLKRTADARRDGDVIYGELVEGAVDGALVLDDTAPELASLFGHPHAASGLLQVAAAAVAAGHGVRPWPLLGRPAPTAPSLGARPVFTTVTHALTGATHTWSVRGGDRQPLVLDSPPPVSWFAGDDRSDLAARIRRDEVGGEGPCRVAVVGDPAGWGERILALDPARREVPRELAPGVWFTDRAVRGDMAAVFGAPAGVGRGMGGALVLAYPRLLDEMQVSEAMFDRAAQWLFDGSNPDDPGSPHQKLWGSSFVSQLHSGAMRQVFDIVPDATIGFCSGETNSLFATGAWRDMEVMYDELLEAGLFSEALAGPTTAVAEAWGEPGPVQWENWRVIAPIDVVREAVGRADRVYLTIINAPGDQVIGGDRDAVRAVVQAIGPHRAHPLGYDVALHGPFIQPYADTWRRLHRRPTVPLESTRLYSHHFGGVFEPTDDSVADALTGMALHTFDFPSLIERAWADGVRVFVEHGPRDGCAKWISRILGERPHLSVALHDGRVPELTRLSSTVAALWVAGRDVDLAALSSLAPRAVPPAGKTRRYRAHPPALVLPAVPAARPPAPQEGDGELLPAPPAGPQPLRVAMGGSSTPHRLPAPAVVHRPDPGTTPGTAHELLVAHHRRTSQAAEATLQLMADSHASFLDQQARALEHYTAALRGQRVPVVPRPASHRPVPPQAPAAPSPRPAPRPPPVSQRPAAADKTPPPAPERTPPPPAADPVPQVDQVDLVGIPAPLPPSGPTFDRGQLERLASGRISEVFGPLFSIQDDFPRQVRMPEPPLLLADRVTGLSGEPGSMTRGTIWTETDVRWDSWYLNDDGTMPAGIMVESGQADLLLISWLGADFKNRGERVYRLLGCDLTYHGGLPVPGDTLRYDIHVDDHAAMGDVRLFFFHYDCHVDGEVRLSVRNGQAGFFTDAELAGSNGILWKPQDEELPPGRVDPPAVPRVPHHFPLEAVRQLSDGDGYSCFGPGYERLATHVRTPRIQSGRMRLIDEVVEVDPTGGPWGRGYLKVVNELGGDEWYMKGHFKDDPCMPGTLMCEGCLQAMAFYLAAMGFTLRRDGWRFEPIPNEPYSLRCRGQVTVSSRRLTYEVFVREVVSGPFPMLYADILGSCDGLGIFHGARMGVRLVPGYPLESLPERLAECHDPGPVAVSSEGFAFSNAAILSAAWGRPSQAFGNHAAMFDGPRHIARLPGPPYLFISRVLETTGALNGMKAPITAHTEYDIPVDPWWGVDSGHGHMPFAVLLEAALQPCGWLSVFAGAPNSRDEDLFFRNLDGTATVFAEVPGGPASFRSQVELTSIATMGPMILFSFALTCELDGEPILQMTTRFGYFTAEALSQQAGLTSTPDQGDWIDRPSDYHVDLTAKPDRFFGGSATLTAGRLSVLHRITGYWPDAGAAGLGRMRAERSIDARDWYFQAHFFGDPVQPGSLGIEAMLQLLAAWMLERGLDRELDSPRFEALATGREFSWIYRGQVAPEAKLVTVELEVTEVEREPGAITAYAKAWLWVDGSRVYASTDMGMRLKGPGPPP